MQVAPIQIRTQMGQLGIQQDSGGVAIQQPQPDLRLRTDHLAVQIDHQRGRLEIDQSKAWEAYGLMGPITWRNKITPQIRGFVQEIIADIARKGDQLAAIEHGGNAIAEQAKDIDTNLFPFSYLGAASFDNVDIRYTPDKLSFSFRGGNVDIQIDRNKPLIERIPAQVRIGIQRYPAIQIEWTGKLIDLVK